MTANPRILQETSLRYFLAVIKWGTISEAAQQLNVASSAISRQISRLESELDILLFERRPRGMVPSSAGEMLALHAKRMQLDNERIVAELQDLHGLKRGIVKIASSEGFAVDFLPNGIAKFRQQYPGIRFSLTVAAPSEVTRMVCEGDVDLGLTFRLSPMPDVRVEYSQPSPIYAVMANDHPLATKTYVTLKQLQPYSLALPLRDTTVRQLFDMCCLQQNLHFDSVFSSNYMEAMLNYATYGDGIALSGELTIRNRLATKRFIALPIADKGMSARHIEVQTLSQRTLPAATAGFLEYLKQRMEIPSVEGRDKGNIS